MRLRDLILPWFSAERRQAIEADSRAWFLRCGKCGALSSIWDIGGIRYNAAGKPRTWFWCPACKKGSWSRIARRDEFDR